MPEPTPVKPSPLLSTMPPTWLIMSIQTLVSACDCWCVPPRSRLRCVQTSWPC
ncbi:hypothetical protein BGW80DRAFT_1332073 [Lactifluus volemus]|nr:hypothetical protein BGW80DRAFT_1332073 [Lactifluus volemus]